MTVETPPLADEAARDRIRDDLDATLFVEAGAGTGKTRELIERLVRLVATGRAELRHVAAITFTDSAAAQLRDRVRLRLEEAAQDAELPGAERARCSDALSELDAAAIETLHAFAQGILADHALEAGLPPVIEVQDEIRSSIAFEEAWTGFLDDLLADPSLEEALLRAFSLGLEVHDLRETARSFHENWDRIEAVGFADEPLPPVDGSLLLARLAEACEQRRYCTDHSDLLYGQLERIDVYRRRLAAATDDLDRLRVLAERTTISSGRGQADNWDGIAPQTIREQLAAAQRVRDMTVSGARRNVLAPLLSSLRDFVLAYANERRRNGRLEFHDLLVQARDLLRRDTAVRDDVRERYSHLLIDEFQDTDPIQIEIATLIAGEATADPLPWHETRVEDGRLFIVGDPKQSIYRFRRADIELYERARERYAAGVVRLTQNFRSVAPVIDWVNAIFEQLMAPRAGNGEAPFTPLERSRGSPSGISVYTLGGPADGKVGEVREREAQDLAQLIQSMKSARWQVEDHESKMQRDARYADIALLLPTRTPLPAIEDALETAGVPYRVESQSLVYDTQEVRDLLSVLRAIDDPTDQVALIAALRAPAFACGDDDLLRYRNAGGRWDYRANSPAELSSGDPVVSAMAALRDLHERRWWEPVSGIVEAVIRERRLLELGFAHRRPRERWQRLRFVLDQARAFAEAGGRTLRQFIDWAERQAEESTRIVETVVPEADDDAVRIMTIHAAKGLEFPIVILAGLNLAAQYRGETVLWGADGQPEARLGHDKRYFETAGYGDTELHERDMDAFEKIRQLYVAATRARDHLIVSLHHARDEKSQAQRLYELCMQSMELWRRPPPGQTTMPLQDGPQRAAFDDSAERRAAWLESRDERIRALGRLPAVAATAIARHAPGGPGDANLEKDAATIDAPPWRRGRAGTAFGRAVHAVLQSIDLTTGANIESAATAQATAEGIPNRARDIARSAHAALDSATVRAAIESGRYWRELYVSAPVEGVLLEGFIDLLYETPEGLVIVDYKTDSLPGAAELDAALARYRLQGAAYALALQEALGRPVSRCVFVFAQPSGAKEGTLDDVPAAMDQVRERLAATRRAP